MNTSRFQARFRLTCEEYLRLSPVGTSVRSQFIGFFLTMAIATPLMLLLMNQIPLATRLGTIGLFAAICIGAPILSRRRLVREYNESPTISAPATLDLFDDELTFDNTIVRMTTPWSDIVRAESRDGLIRLHTRKGQQHVLPERALGGREQIEACRDFLRSRIERTNFKPLLDDSHELATPPSAGNASSPAIFLPNRSAANERPMIPSSIRYIANTLLFCALCGIMFVSVAFAMPSQSPSETETTSPHWMFYYVNVSMAVMTVVSLPAGLMLHRGHRVGRVTTWIAIPLILPAVPLGTVAAMVTLWFITRPESRRYFASITGSPPGPPIHASPVHTNGSFEILGELNAKEMAIVLKATPGGSGITFYITMALAAGTIAVQLIMPGHAATGTTLKVIAIAVIALLTVVFFALGRYSARSQAKQTTERIYLVNEDGLATIDRDLNQTVDWSLIRRAVTKGDVILLYNQAGTIAVAMPHRHVGGPERLHELDALIRRKVADCSQL